MGYGKYSEKVGRSGTGNYAGCLEQRKARDVKLYFKGAAGTKAMAAFHIDDFVDETV